MTDVEGLITWTNQAFRDLCGHPREAILKRKPGSFLQGPDTDPETVAHIRRAIRNHEPVDAELINYHRNGEPYWVSLRITPLRSRAGKLEGYISIERNITSTRKHRYALERQVADLYNTLLYSVGSGSLDEPEVSI